MSAHKESTKSILATDGGSKGLEHRGSIKEEGLFITQAPLQ